MRVFAAVDLRDDTRRAIGDEQRRIAARLGTAAAALRFVYHEHLHLTLIFLGAIEEPRAAVLVDAMRADVPMAPFALAFGGLGTFPRQGAPRVLWLGLLEGMRETVALRQQMARRVEQAGATIEPRRFHPHLTLARWRDRNAQGRTRLPEDGHLVARDEAAAVTLYESRLSAAGPAYTPLARVRLTCP